MASSQGTARKNENSSLPVPVNAAASWGVGNGFRFHYEGKTSQSEWTKRKYRSANDSQPKQKPQPEVLPELYARDVARTEDELSVYDRLIFAIEVSLRYHSHRHKHYENVFRTMMLAIVCLSAFAFMTASNTRVFLGLCIIGLAAGTFVWNVTHLSRLHDVIRGQYQSLLEHIRLHEEPTAHDIRHWRNIRLKIRAKEPAVFWAVSDDCYYETVRAWDLEPKHRDKLPLVLRPFKNWFRI